MIALACVALLGLSPFGSGVQAEAIALDPGALNPRVWSERLRESDLARRERSLDELVQLARADAAVAGQVRLWAQEPSGELAWNARFAVRELEQPLALASNGLDPHTLAWCRVFEQAEVRQSAPALNGLWGVMLLDEVPDFGLTLQLIEHELDGELPAQLEALALPGVPDPNSTAALERLSIQIESSGDRLAVQVQRTDANGTREENYVGNSLPELLERNVQLRALIAGAQEERGRVSTTVRTDILGVQVGENPAPAQAQRLGLGAGAGVRVLSTLSGTIASQLNVRHGSVLVQLNGRALSSGDDITEALKERSLAQGVTLTWYDATGVRLRRSWCPPPAAPAQKRK